MSDTEPTLKRLKPETEAENVAEVETPKTCKHFVIRKKRFCRITSLAKGEDYCGEHLPLATATTATPTPVPAESHGKHTRIPCPLDPKHTVYARNLEKHLQICNAAPKDQPDYIVSGLNAGPKTNSDADDIADFKLADVDEQTIETIIEKINKMYDESCVDDQIEELWLTHPLLAGELSKSEYGAETRKHLLQTSAILGYLEHYRLLNDHTSFIEFGAGKGQVAFWLAQAIVDHTDSNVLLIDRASLRHKKDNKLDDTHAVQRIRADICDFDMNKFDLLGQAKAIVGMGKHLCGAATDFAIRCIQNGNAGVDGTQRVPKTDAFIVALCCHHRCDWQPFVGKEFFVRHNISRREFAIITKMVGWAICGTGMSRERRKEIEARRNGEPGDVQTNGDDTKVRDVNRELRDSRREVGRKCKRLIDHARMEFLRANGYQCSLKSYVSADITLENICLVALRQQQQ